MKKILVCCSLSFLLVLQSCASTRFNVPANEDYSTESLSFVLVHDQLDSNKIKPMDFGNSELPAYLKYFSWGIVLFGVVLIAGLATQ